MRKDRLRRYWYPGRMAPGVLTRACRCGKYRKNDPGGLVYSSPGPLYVRCALAHTTGVLLDCNPIRILRQSPTEAFIAALRSTNANLLIYTFGDWLDVFFICPVTFMIPSRHQCFFPYFVIRRIFLCNCLLKQFA